MRKLPVNDKLLQALMTRRRAPSDVIIYAVLVEAYEKKLQRTHAETVRRIAALGAAGVDITNVSMDGVYSEDLDRLISLLGSWVKDTGSIVLNKSCYEALLDVLEDYRKDAFYKGQVDMLRRVLDISGLKCT